MKLKVSPRINQNKIIYISSKERMFTIMTMEEIRDDIMDDICGLNMEIALNQSDIENLERELDKIKNHGDWFEVKSGLQSSYEKAKRRQIELENMLTKSRKRLEDLSA